MISKGTWVLIQADLLAPEDRASTLPEATRRVPLRLWLKGTLLTDALLHENATIQTVTGRIVSGCLIEANPSYRHDFGTDCPELRTIRHILRKAMNEAEDLNP
jgi:hypothetical protein